MKRFNLKGQFEMNLCLKKLSVICLFFTGVTHGQEELQINGKGLELNIKHEFSAFEQITYHTNTLISIEGKKIVTSSFEDSTFLPRVIDIYHSIEAQKESAYIIDRPDNIIIEADTNCDIRGANLKTGEKALILAGKSIKSTDTIIKAQDRVVLRSPQLEVDNLFITTPACVELIRPSGSHEWLKGIEIYPAEFERPFTYFLQGTLNFAPPSTQSWFIIIGANKLNFIIDNLAADPTRKKDQAARTLQSTFRNYLFKKNQQRIYGEMYKQGLLYRDGKVAGLEKDSFLANAYAGANFYPLARLGDVKAQHNLAMVNYKQRRYPSALKWFERAAQQGFEPSQRKLEKLRTEISTLELPFELWLHISTYFDDQTLLAFRAANWSTANVIETLRRQQAEIKAPLSCLTSQEKTHPFPHTLSYFIRKNYMKLGTQGSTAALSESCLKCADFCQEWSFVGETLFRSLGDLTADTGKKDLASILAEFKIDILKQENSEPDVREMKLWLNILPLIMETGKHIDQITYHGFTLNCLALVNEFPKMEKRDMGRFYVTLAGQFLMERNLLIPAKLCFSFSAKQRDRVAQNYLGAIFENEGNIEEAKKYYSMAVKQDYSFAQNNLGSLLMKEGDLSYSKDLFHKAAEKEIPIAFFNLGVIYTQEKDIPTAKKYLKKAADKNFPKAHFNLASLYEEEYNTEQAKYHYQIAADLGMAQAQYNYAMYLHREGKLEEAKKYLKMAAVQGNQFAMINLIHLYVGTL